MTRLARRVAWLVWLSALAGAMPWFGVATLGAQATRRLVVIVHADVPVQELTRAGVRRLFLLRQEFWPDGSRVLPVNLPAGSPLREAFSHRVLGGGSRDFSSYWNDLYFQGTLPPATLASEQAVLLYVARTRGAIGYVTEEAATKLPDGVREVLTLAP